MSNLTPNFSAWEFDVHEPFPPELYAKRAQLAQLAQWFRDLAGVPGFITSAYRNPARNASVGGADHSQHEQGEAIDVEFIGITDRELTRRLMVAELAGSAPSYGQFIVYTDTGHTHLSLGTRRQKLLASRDDNGARTYATIDSPLDVPPGFASPTIVIALALLGLLFWWIGT